MRLLLGVSFLCIMVQSKSIIDDSLSSRLLSRLFGISESSDEIRTTTNTPTTSRRIVYHEISVPSHNATCGLTPDMIRSKRKRRVIGGYQAPRGYYPYIASITKYNRQTNRREHYCGATLIHPKFLLTAAHCFEYGDQLRMFTVVLGVWDKSMRESTEQRYTIKDVHMHDYYNVETLENDIAIIELRTSVRLTEHVALACLPPKDFNYYPGRLSILKGWGTLDNEHNALENEEYNTPNRLQVGHVPIIDDETCKKVLGYRFLSRSQFCAGYLQGGIDTCQGDSGGPLVCQENEGALTVVGITSWGYECAKKNSPGVYTKVSKYIDWIEKILKYRKKYVYSYE